MSPCLIKPWCFVTSTPRWLELLSYWFWLKRERERWCIWPLKEGVLIHHSCCSRCKGKRRIWGHTHWVPKFVQATCATPRVLAYKSCKNRGEVLLFALFFWVKNSFLGAIWGTLVRICFYNVNGISFDELRVQI